MLVAITQINQRVAKLSDINRDVLIGKRNSNCISCSKGLDTRDGQRQFKGSDGKLYLGSDKGSPKFARGNSEEPRETEMSMLEDLL